jgi:hypothetical protein
MFHKRLQELILKYFKKTIVLALPLLFAASCAHVHPEDDSYESRGQGLESTESCESRCMEEFHSCKDNRAKGSGASECAHQKNSCKGEC